MFLDAGRVCPLLYSRGSVSELGLVRTFSADITLTITLRQATGGGVAGYQSPPSPQKLYFSANWICRMLVKVEVITPKFDGGATFELPPQPTDPGVPNSTWFGALNISTRN
jgi:hypothetical protein